MKQGEWCMTGVNSVVSKQEFLGLRLWEEPLTLINEIKFGLLKLYEFLAKCSSVYYQNGIKRHFL